MDCAAKLNAAKSPNEPKITRPKPRAHKLYRGNKNKPKQISTTDDLNDTTQ